MDNLMINPEEFLEGYKKIKKAIDMKAEINQKLEKAVSSGAILDVDLTNITYIIERVYEKLDELYLRLEKTKDIMIDMDYKIAYLYSKMFDVNYLEENSEEKLDKLKNNNSNTGAVKSLDAESIIANNENALDKLKTKNGNIICDKSSNTGSILEILKTEKGVNLVLDGLKNNNGNVDGIKSLNTTSILYKEI